MCSLLSQKRLLNAGLAFWLFSERGGKNKDYLWKAWHLEEGEKYLLTNMKTYKFTDFQSFSAPPVHHKPHFIFLISGYKWLSPYFLSMLTPSPTSVVQKHKYRIRYICSIARQHSYLPLCYPLSTLYLRLCIFTSNVRCEPLFLARLWLVPIKACAPQSWSW